MPTSRTREPYLLLPRLAAQQAVTIGNMGVLPPDGVAREPRRSVRRSRTDDDKLASLSDAPKAIKSYENNVLLRQSFPNPSRFQQRSSALRCNAPSSAKGDQHLVPAPPRRFG